MKTLNIRETSKRGPRADDMNTTDIRSSIGHGPECPCDHCKISCLTEDDRRELVALGWNEYEYIVQALIGRAD